MESGSLGAGRALRRRWRCKARASGAAVAFALGPIIALQLAADGAGRALHLPGNCTDADILLTQAGNAYAVLWLKLVVRNCGVGLGHLQTL